MPFPRCPPAVGSAYWHDLEMPESQDSYPNDLAEMASWVCDSTDPGMRVLEIGCGDGALVERLTAAGLIVLGVDPNATPTANVRAIEVEDLDQEPFDVVFASVSLHHLADSERTTEALRRLTRIGSVVLVREFDKERLEHEPTLRWWYQQRLARAATIPCTEEDDIEPSAPFEHFVDEWRAHMDHHVLPWTTVRGAIAGAGFASEYEAPMPYLFRWGLDEAVRPLEEALIAQNRINAVGVHWRGRRLD